jgi:hypothetical protein
MHEGSSGDIPVDEFAFGGSAFQQLDQNQTGEIISLSGITGVFEGTLADGRYQLPQCSVDPVIATVCFHSVILSLNNAADRRSFATQLNCKVVELFLNFLSVHNLPPTTCHR